MPLVGAALALLLPGCVVEQQDFEALREQVRVQQRQINDLKARQEEQGLRVDTLGDGFKILSDKAEENARRIDEQGERASWPATQAAPSAAAVAEAAEPGVRATSTPAPVAAATPANPPPQPSIPVPTPAAGPAPAAAEAPVLLTNQPKAGMSEPAPAEEIITAGPRAEKLYASALTLYSSRDYQQAITKFEEFVAAYPDHKLAGNAQYWVGECYYSQKRFSDAAAQFAEVEKTHPTSPKVPAALLKRGLSLAELKKWPEARAALQRVVEKYPQSEEAAKARERLDRWKQQQ
jgi:tol-pal system protein YbgF